MTEITAPWTPEQVTALNHHQDAGAMHPFTCGNLHDDGQSPVLAATVDGWRCPNQSCNYEQDWAHAFMARHQGADRGGVPVATVQATEYEVSILPEGDINRHVFNIDVAYRGAGQWAVTRHGSCLGIDGTWAQGIKAYDRGDDWLTEHRFDLDTALRLARGAAPHIVVNGHTALDAYRAATEEPTA